MIKELFLNYSSFVKVTKKESIIAIFSGIIGAITETVAIYFLAEIIRNLEYLKLSDKDLNLDINLAEGALIFLIFCVASSIIFFIYNKYLVIFKSKL